MPDLWSMLLALLAIVLPLWLAWVLLGPRGRPRADRRAGRDRTRR
jgi:hypothetical protein